MKSIFAALLIILLIFPAFSQETTLEIRGVAPPTAREVVLKSLDPDEMNYREQARQELSSDTHFAFSLPFEQPNLYQLVFDGKEVVDLSITGPATIVVAYREGAYWVEGSPSTDAMRAFRQTSEELQARHFAQLKADIDQASAAGDEARLEELTRQVEPALQAFLVEFRQAIVELGPTPAGYYALQFSDFNKELDFIESRLQAFQEAIPESPVTLVLEQQLAKAKAIVVGGVPPAIEAVDRDGRPVSLADFQGRVLLIDFWASWCRACRIEHPKFVELYREYHERGFDILSISQDDSPDAWQQAIAKDGTGLWPQVLDADKQISERYSVSSLPQNVLLGPDGRIVAKNLGEEDLRKWLQKVVDE